MRFTDIRRNKRKLTKSSLNRLARCLQSQVQNEGFVAWSRVVNSSRIDLSNSGCSFTINLNKLPYNARWTKWTIEAFKEGHLKKPFIRTTTPTWEQRKDYNHLVNILLDRLKITCRVVSGPYEVRCKQWGRVNSWYDHSLSYTNSFNYTEIKSIKESVWEMIDLERKLKGDRKQHLKVVSSEVGHEV